MISDKERREVVRELRGLDVFTDPIDGTELYDSGEVENALGFKYEDYGWYYASGVDALADLIDRPTCQMAECSIDHGSRSWGMRCTACGKEFEHMKPSYGWSYCPNCGAEVVEKGEDDDQ